MSQHHVSYHTLPEGGEKFSLSKASKLTGILIGFAVLGLLGSAYFAFTSIEAFAYSWLYAVFIGFTFVAGGVFWILLHNASNSGWGVSLRRLFEHLGLLALPLGVLALPLILIPQAREALWEWTGIHAEASHHVNADAPTTYDALHHMAESDPHIHPLVEKYGFLNMGFWYFRFFAYFLILWHIARSLRRFFIKQEIDGDIKHTMSARAFSCRWLLFYALTVTFAAVDWIMALDYTWFSTMWGVYHFAGCAWSSMALMILIVTYLRSIGYLHQVVSEEHYHLMGKLLFAFTVFWAYIAFSQYFLIWYANIPEETRFYFIRNTGAWRNVSIFIVVGHFILPFLLLLSQPRKKNPLIMAGVCAWVLFMHLVDIYWNVIPERAHSLLETKDYTGTPWIAGAWVGDIFALFAVLGTLGFLYFRSLGGNSLYAWRDPRLLESANVHN
jgi:hypothetical protein